MSDIIVSLLQTADSIANQFIINGYAELVSAYKPAILALVGLSITVYGYAVVNGWLQLSAQQFAKRVLLIGAVVSLALHWDFFSEYVYQFFTNAPNAIAIHLVQAIPGSHFNDSQSIYNALDEALDSGVQFGQAAWERGSWSSWMPWVWAILTWLMTFAFTGIALLELIIAKFGLAILLVLSPLAIPCLLFSSTKEMIFNNWTRHIIGFSLIPIFVMAAVALSLMLCGNIILHIGQSIKNDWLTIKDLAPFILCTLAGCALLFKAAQVAVSIAGGISASISHGVARWGYGKFKDTFFPGKEQGRTQEEGSDKSSKQNESEKNNKDNQANNDLPTPEPGRNANA